jgi:hypothetical protein
MGLRAEQSAFVKDVTKLLVFIESKGIEVTFGEALRTIYQQKEYIRTGKSKTMHSKHLKKLAIDLNFFIDGKLSYSKKDLQEIGDYWESLNEKNSWGRNWKNFKDVPHFQRTA